MTPEDRELDGSVFQGQSLNLYRLAKVDYANLSGLGSALYPGRWNRLGQEAIYTSTDVSTTVLERLVHTPKGSIPRNLAMMQISLTQDWRIRRGKDRLARASLLVFTSLARARAEFETEVARDEAFLGVAVPSVIVPAWNVVLYPRHPLFWDHVSLKALDEFRFDPRLFPEMVDSTK